MTAKRVETESGRKLQVHKQEAREKLDGALTRLGSSAKNAIERWSSNGQNDTRSDNLLWLIGIIGTLAVEKEFPAAYEDKTGMVTLLKEILNGKGQLPIDLNSVTNFDLANLDYKNSHIIEKEITSPPQINNGCKEIIEQFGTQISDLNGKLFPVLNDISKIIKSLDSSRPHITSLAAKLDETGQSLERLHRKSDGIEKKIEDSFGTLEKQLSKEIYLAQDNQIKSTKQITSLILNVNDKCDKVLGQIDGKIDLSDAREVLNIRREIEVFVRSELIKTVSKQIMPVLDILKQQSTTGPGNFSALVNDLENRCRQAGLVPIDKLYM